MVDCLQYNSKTNKSVFLADGSIIPHAGQLRATVINFLFSDHLEYEFEIRHPSGVSWQIIKRYRQFRSLMDILTRDFGLSIPIKFPSRKILNNLSMDLARERGTELQDFLNNILQFYTLPPPPLAGFIDWEIYDIYGITTALARRLYREGEQILKSNSIFELEVPQLNAINCRQLSPASTNLFGRPEEDFGHVISFISSVKRVKLVGSMENLHYSNIRNNSLEFDFSPFLSMYHLELDNVDLRSMHGFESIKCRIVELTVHRTIKSLKHLLLGDLYAAGGGDWVFGEDPVSTTPWSCIKSADFSNNYLHVLDQTIALMPNVEILDLSNNVITEIACLKCLPFLRVLYLAGNQLHIGESFATQLTKKTSSHSNIQETSILRNLREGEINSTCSISPFQEQRVNLPPLHDRLGEIQILDLSNNGFRSAQLVHNIQSLQHLDLSNNKIDSFDELRCLGDLCCLSTIELSGNPISNHPYYRRNVFDLLGPRFDLILLDKSPPLLHETEMIQLHRALKQGHLNLQTTFTSRGLEEICEAETSQNVSPPITSLMMTQTGAACLNQPTSPPMKTPHHSANRTFSEQICASPSLSNSPSILEQLSDETDFVDGKTSSLEITLDQKSVILEKASVHVETSLVDKLSPLPTKCLSVNQDCGDESRRPTLPIPNAFHPITRESSSGDMDRSVYVLENGDRPPVS